MCGCTTQGITFQKTKILNSQNSTLFALHQVLITFFHSLVTILWLKTFLISTDPGFQLHSFILCNCLKLPQIVINNFTCISTFIRIYCEWLFLVFLWINFIDSMFFPTDMVDLVCFWDTVFYNGLKKYSQRKHFWWHVSFWIIFFKNNIYKSWTFYLSLFQVLKQNTNVKINGYKFIIQLFQSCKGKAHGANVQL